MIRFKAPLECFVWITGKCNLNCVFCLLDDEVSSLEMPYETLMKICEEIVKNKVLKAYLTGGEPFLHKNLFDALDYLKRNDVFVEITTNGTLITGEIARKLKKTGVDRVQVSCNGYDDFTNDRIMGESYFKIVRGVKYLLKNSISTHVRITATSSNIKIIPAIISNLKNLGVEKFEVYEVIPSGRGGVNYDSLRPGIKKLKKLRNKLENMDGITFNSVSLGYEENGGPVNCTVGEGKSFACQILPDGNLIECAPSYLWRHKNNVLEKGLPKAWEDTAEFKKYTAEPPGGKCSRCLKLDVCKGGCRALSYQANKNINEENRFCDYFMEEKWKRRKSG